ncbi:DUF7471 family protein [Halorussus sp. AFM4]|uniref:DUF7471 family protein n=1 Tax=Halorussus sp. AFM4 TaxID=3421651 RepID=UPI003EBDADAD
MGRTTNGSRGRSVEEIHTGGTHEVTTVLVDPWLLAMLALAGLITAVPAGLALASLARRRSRSYFLVALALFALFVRTVVAIASMMGALGHSAHHLLEHGLDVAMSTLVIAAVYYAREIVRGTTERTSP